MEKTTKVKAHSSEDRVLLLVGVIAFGIALYWLLQGVMSEVSIEGRAAIGHLKVEGSVRRRHAKSLHWGEIRDHGLIYLGDTVYVPKGTVAELAWGEGKVLVLEADSMIQFDEVTQDTIRIALLDGANQETKTLKLEGDRPVRVTKILRPENFGLMPYPNTEEYGGLPDESRFLNEEQQRLRAEIDRVVTRAPAILPEIKLYDASQAMSRVDDYQLKLLTPEPGQYDLRQSPWLYFSWKEIPISDVQYRVEVSRDRLFRRSLTHETNKNAISIQPQDTGDYYWRVTAIKDGITNVSSAGRFRMVRTPGSQLFKNRALSSVPSGYVWEVSMQKNFSRILKNGVNQEQECRANQLSPGKYYCRIREVATNQVKRRYAFRVGGQ